MNKKKANEFLKYIANLVKENPNIHFNNAQDCRLIYHLLIKKDVKESDKKVNVSKEGMFEKWIKRYSTSFKTNVFVNPTWEYFCQFISTNLQVSTNQIKIYVPTVHKYLEENANTIFDFLEKENIQHQSKIAKEIRFDNIVIRVNNEEDARKVIDFLSNNHDIQKGLIDANPFALSYNNIALACDGNLSYNSIVSNYIGLYIEYKNNSNTLGNVSLEEFINFIRNYYEDTFIKMNNLDDIKNHFYIGNNAEIEYCLPYQQVYFKHITELIIKSSQDDFSLKDFMDHFAKCNDKELIKREMTELANKKNDLTMQKLLMESLDIMSKKYGTEKALNQINMYLSTGDLHFITRTDGLRDRIRDSTLRDYLIKELMNYNTNLVEYINIISKGNNVDIKLLNDYFVTAINKYGKEVAVTNFINYIQNGRENNITRTDDLRDRIMKSNIRDSLIKYFKENNYRPEDLYDFFMNYIENNINNKSERAK